MSRRTITSYTANHIQSKIKEYVENIDKIRQDMNSTILYEKIDEGKELVEQIKESGVLEKATDFVEKIINKETKIMNRSYTEQNKMISNLSQNNDLSIRKRIDKLNEIKDEFKNTVDILINDLMHDTNVSIIPSTLLYYYNQLNRLEKELTKKKADIADIQLSINTVENEQKKDKLGHELYEQEKDELGHKLYEQEKDELGHRLYEQYEILNNYMVDIEIAYILSEGYRKPRSYKIDRITTLIFIINDTIEQLNKLSTRRTRRTRRTPNRSNVYGKKKTKNRRLGRTKIKSNKRKK